MILLLEAAMISQRVAETSSRLAKVRELAAFLQSLERDEIPVAIAFLSGEPRQGKLGVGHAALTAARSAAVAGSAALSLLEVDAAFSELAAITGKGAAAARARSLLALFSRATAPEQDFLLRLITGELRQGALAALMLEALARAADVPLATLRKAAMAAGGLGDVACALLTEGATALSGFSVRLMQPVLPMLSQSAENTDAALQRLGSAAFEWKLDGARVQVHKAGNEVRIYTRKLNEVSARVPEIVEAVRALTPVSLILDGEAIALREDGSPHAFQITMRRFGRKLEVDALRRKLPLSVFFFDCLLRDDAALIEQPAVERYTALEASVPAGLIVPRVVTDDPEVAARFFAEAVRRGHEGVVAKTLTSPYEAGRRGAGWLKIKRANTLDLVVLAAEWGHGRRHGRLSNLHLGALDPANGAFVMLGKTFKGLTDEMLEWQTAELLLRETRRDSYTVYVKPEMVVEVAFNEVQASSQYPGGVTLRFARVKGYRPDKTARDADTIDTIHKLYAAQVHAGEPR